MFSKEIKKILDSFTGDKGEPKTIEEIYMLRAMWVMSLSEFESKIKSDVKSFIDEVRQRNVDDVPVVMFMTAFIKNKKDVTRTDILNTLKKNPMKMEKDKFILPKITYYNPDNIATLFSSIGIILTRETKTSLKKMETIANTRNKIAHGDDVQITKVQLLGVMEEMGKICDDLSLYLNSSIDYNRITYKRFKLKKKWYNIWKKN